MIQERRGMMKVWNLSLIVGTFALTTFGTFLTRGSILSSVHAFAQSIVGPLYLAFLVLVLIAGFGLIAARSWQLRSEGRFDSALSREAAFLGNNLLLLGLTFVVLLGTIFPLVMEALTDRQSSVGGPYFKETTVPLFLLLMFLMAVGPLLPWRRASRQQLRDRLTAPTSAGALTIVGLALTGVRDLAAVAAFGLAAFVVTANAGELARGVRAFARAKRVGVRVAVPEAFRRNRRLYGGLVVHVGVAVAVVGITASSAFAKQTEIRLERGQVTTFAGYELRYLGQRSLKQPHRTVFVADVAVSKDGRDLGRLTPSLNVYPSSVDPIGTPSIKYGVLRDLYSSVLGFDAEGATFRFFLNPGVLWLWVGAAVMALGGLLAAWPSRRTPVPLPTPAEERALAEVG
jgi:cytochrome c-type biogenesis protein CcmF